LKAALGLPGVVFLWTGRKNLFKRKGKKRLRVNLPQVHQNQAPVSALPIVTPVIIKAGITLAISLAGFLKSFIPTIITRS